jgi:biopolymer transport protein ExbD
MLKADVSFVNLIDVTMVLLIIFMITAPVMHDMIPVDLPSGEASRANITDGILVTVDNDGAIFIDKEKIADADFERRFVDIWKTRSGEPVFIRGDVKVEYGRVMTVLTTVKKIGGSNVGLVVEEQPTPRKR